MTPKPRIWHIVVFPHRYMSHHYFQSERRAKEFVKQVFLDYGVQGKVVKVKECR